MTRVVDGSQRGATSEKADAVLIAEMHLPGSDALAALFRRYIRLVHRVAANILRDDAEAEDVTQEVFLEVYRKAHLYDPSRGAVRCGCYSMPIGGACAECFAGAWPTGEPPMASTPHCGRPER